MRCHDMSSQGTSIMQQQLFLVVGLLLSSCVPGQAQTLTTQVLLARATPEPTPILVPASPSTLPSKVTPRSRLPQKPVAQSTLLLFPAYTPDPNPEMSSLVEEFRTPYLTESRIVVVQFWRERLQLDGFESSIHTQNPLLGLPGSGGLLPRTSDQAGVANSADLDGISLVFHFGRDARTTRQPQLWRHLTWIRGG